MSFKSMFLAICLLFCSTAAPADQALLEEVVSKVRQHFFDPEFRGLNLEQAYQEAKAEMSQAKTWEQKSEVINQLLRQLKTSHTAYFPPNSKGFFELQGIFAGLNGKAAEAPSYRGIGLESLLTPQGRFVSAVWPGFPAAQAGVQVGDQILSVDGQPYQEIDSFRSVHEVTLNLLSQRDQPPKQIQVPVIRILPSEAFEKTLRESAVTVPLRGREIGYVQVWSYAGQRYQEALEEILCRGALKDCDGVVIDLRDGWGGARPEYLNLFNPKVPSFDMIDREGKVRPWNTQWRKPVAFLINEGSRSGKEILALGVRNYQLGPLVGTRTAGACVAGRMFALSEGVLYLAVSDVRVDGVRIEGQGVEPTLRVERCIPFCQGADPQKQAALEAVRALLP